MYSKNYKSKVILDYEDDEEYEKIQEESNGNGQSINDDIKKNIFHYLTGKYDYDKDKKKYSFELTTGGKIDYDEVVSLYDPGYDATFKELFLNHPERLKDFLNKAYFENKMMAIKELDYLKGEYYQIGKTYGFNSLSSDIACAAKINDENDNTKNTILIDAEIQIGWRDILYDRLFEYGSLMRNRYTNQQREKQLQSQSQNEKKKYRERQYNNTIVIAFVLDKERQKDNLSSQIQLIKNKNNESNGKILNNFQIAEIHLFYEVEKIIKGKDIKLFGNELNDEGKDWLKLIGLRCWAKESKEIMKYILPKLKDNEKYSNNEHINESIMLLIKGTEGLTELYTQINFLIEEGEARGEVRGEEKGKKISEISITYNLFVEKKNPLELFKLRYCYKRNEIKEIFDNHLKEIKIDQNELNDFINYLEGYNYITN